MSQEFFYLSNNSYISCIKIAGVPILPPLISPERRLELQEYKRKAIEREKLIDARVGQQKVTVAINKTLENSLAFDNNNALNDLEECDQMLPKEKVPLIQTNKPASQLSFNIFDVTEYNDNGIVLFNDYPKAQVSLAASMVEFDLTNSDTVERNLLPRLTQSQPRLLRSNSYTLESPSPVLLEHFKQHVKSQDDSACQTLPHSSGSSCNFNSMESVVKTDCLFMTTENLNEIIKDLASVHFGNILEGELNDKSNDVVQIRTAMPDVADIKEFINRHADVMPLSQDSVQCADFQFGCNHTFNVSEGTNNKAPQPRENNSGVFPLYEHSSSYNTYHSTGSLTDALNTSSVLLIDFESDTADNLTPCFDNDPIKIDIVSNEISNNSFNRLLDIRKTCSRELFGDNSIKNERKFREQWAATVLTAATRGYFVRRLKRTERVKNLIQTIGDALTFALSLRSENIDTFQPPDVELHRRLIQQISSACFEFYDIFFGLTIKEQLEIIALDRQIIKERLSRPNSTSSVKLNSGASQRHSFHSKQKKTLVSSLVA